MSGDLDIKAVSLRWLGGQQQADGSFLSYASSSCRPFLIERQHPAVFPTALIANCLERVGGADAIRGRAVDFLRQERDETGSWNYWRRDSEYAINHPYPDDLDDTAVALTACVADSSDSSGETWARLAKLLISAEVAPGGPYRTWFLRPGQDDKWRDVDPAVNANIGGLLARLQVELPGLTVYLEQCLIDNRLESPYYVGDIPVIYFLARWYKGSLASLLKSAVQKRLQDTRLNSLQLAMLLTAGCQIGLRYTALDAAKQRLFEKVQTDHWPPEALYVDPNFSGTQYYAGSAALTTAMALEALATHKRRSQRSAPQSTKLTATDRLLERARVQINSLPDGLRADYSQGLEDAYVKSRSHQFLQLARQTAEAYRLPVATETLNSLELAGLHGWLAYTIYDDFWDGQGRPDKLAVANQGLHWTIRHFYLALPRNNDFQNCVNRALVQMNNANHWETVHARAKISQGRLRYKLPDYADYHQLAEKSWGYTLASCGVLLASGRGSKSQEYQQLQDFFRHFLIARQLNDDAHDWEDDLRQCRLSAVATLLLADFPSAVGLIIDDQIPDLRLHFWQQAMPQVAGLINRHLGLARQALEQSGMVDSSAFVDWLDKIARATDQAMQGRRQARQFIAALKD